MALQGVASTLQRDSLLSFSFHAFGNHVQAEHVGKADRRSNDADIFLKVPMRDERFIEFQTVDLEPP